MFVKKKKRLIYIKYFLFCWVNNELFGSIRSLNVYRVFDKIDSYYNSNIIKK